MFKLIKKPESVKMSRKLAEHYCNMEPLPGDRPLSDRRCQLYIKLVQSGQFRSVNWATVRVKETDRTYRVNGKHTSTVFSIIDSPQPIYTTIEHYECDTLEDAAKLYTTFDNASQSRNTRDINWSFSQSVPRLVHLSPTLVGLCVSGINYGLKQDAYSAIPPAERAEVLLTPEGEKFSLFLTESLLKTNPEPKSLKRVPVIGAVYKTWLKDETACLSFWLAVRDESGSTADLPDRVLGRWLALNGVNNGGGAKNHRKAPAREFYCRCLHAWNAWRKGTKTLLKYYKESEVPEAV